jgi:hypothetical protein
MSFTKSKSVYLFLIVLSLLVSTAIFAVDKRELPSAQKTNFGPRDISSQNEVNGFFKPSRWGNDVPVANGPIYSGFYTDYDDSGNIYAVRCTTYYDSSNARINIYASTDGGASWSLLNYIGAGGGNYKMSYPVILTGNLGNKLYLFYLRSIQSGDLTMARFSKDGNPEGLYDIKADIDTISYFSVCTDDGSHFMVAYQKEENTHKIYTITSNDSGVTWGEQTYITGDGQHPDIAYGNNGYVYLVFESTTEPGLKKYVPDYEIIFCKNVNYGAHLSWRDVQALTDDDYDDHYPKVAALHTLPESTACVWVAYNHETSYEEKDTLQYDDGSANYQWRLPDQYGTDLFNVRFTPAWDYWLKSAQLLFYRKTGTGGIRVYVWADTSGFPAQKTDSVDVPNDSIKPYPTWTIVNFPAKSRPSTIQSDFHIGYTLLGPPSTDSVSIISDDGQPVGTEHRSMDSYYGTWETIYSWSGHDVNFMIRADVERMQSTDLRFAYSTNSGKDWSKNHELANSGYADEMAADLKAYRSSTNIYVDLCYVKYSGVVKSGSDIYYTFTEADRPGQFTPHNIINEHWANCLPDGREVCQLTYPVSNEYPGIVYAGAPLKKDAGENLDLGGWNLYYDYHGWVGVEEETGEEKLPAEFSLSNNYPNPFNPETRIGYSVPKACQVKLEVFNILGQRVRMLVDENQTAGKREITWDGKDENRNEVASGVYFYRLRAGDFTQTKKMVLIR